MVDAWIDASLNQYGEAEPRPGLEGRVWANVRAERRRRLERGRRSTAAAADEPKLEQFPSPRPLSTQERLLLLYLRETPQQEVLSAASSAESLDDLQIKDLTVAPTDAPTAVPKSSAQN